MRYYNKKALDVIGIPEETVTTKPLQDFYLTKLKVMEVLKSGEPIFDKEIFVTTKKGEKQHLFKTILPIKDEKGNVIGVLDKIQGIQRAKSFINNLSVSRAVYTFNRIVHESQAMKKTIQTAKSVADTDMTVLIQGESIGRNYLHMQYTMPVHGLQNLLLYWIVLLFLKNLLKANYLDMPKGHLQAQKGGKLGKFELANGGTIFLDEIGKCLSICRQSC